jgi:hypothetical protein
MKKPFLAIVGATFSALVLSTGAACSGTYPFGDEPYTLDWGSFPQIQSGCWKWNWQQYQWNNYCPVYVHPKAYMYPRSSRAALRTKS